MSSFESKSRKSAEWVPSYGLRNIQDRTQHDRCLRRSLLAATTAMIPQQKSRHDDLFVVSHFDK